MTVTTFHSGNFEIQVGNGYPVAMTLKKENNFINFTHKEISDLEYIVKRAKRKLKGEMPERFRHET